MELLKEQGYIHIKKCINENTIDKILEKINFERKNLPNYGYKNKHQNLGNRIGRLHLKIDDYYKCLDFVKDEINSILNKPIIMGSLTFENGSSQQEHIDSWFFYTKPEKDMIGIWIALEDVEDDAGPLFYYENSHLLETKDPSDFDYKDTNTTSCKLANDLKDKIKNINKINVNVKKGDIFIWDYNLVHGGSPILNINKTRNSIVFHLIDEDAELYSFNDYMKYGKNIDQKFKITVTIKEKNGWKYQDFGCIEYVNNNCEYSKKILN